MIDKVIKDALIKEINAKVNEKLKVQHNLEIIDTMLKQYHETGVIPDKIGSIQISISFDTGWKKGTRHNYDSNSGYAYLIGCGVGKVIGMLVY